MPRNRNWFDRLRDRFFPATGREQEEGKAKGRKRWVFKRMEIRRPHSVPVTTSASSKEESQTDPVKRRNRDGSDSAGKSIGGSDASYLATTAAISSQFGKKCQIEADLSALARRHMASTKIQSVFRGYLARKALRALKGLVKLQAIIRGRAVRRRTVATLRCLQSIVNIQSQVCATRYHLSQEKVERKERRHRHSSGLPRYDDIDNNNDRRRWDDVLLTAAEEVEVSMLSTSSKARTRREKIKSDSPLRRVAHSAELEDRKWSGKLRNQAEQQSRSGTVLVPREEEDIKRVDTVGGKQQQLTKRRLYINNSSPQCLHHGQDYSPTLSLPPPRRSLYHKSKRRSSSITVAEDYDNKPDSSSSYKSAAAVVPTYMASTESAKAKAKTSAILLSSPRRGGGGGGRLQLISALSDGDSPYKCKMISPMSSVNSERTWTGTSLLCGGGGGGNKMDWSAEVQYQRPICSHSLQGKLDAAARPI